jgi:hypothetical protein
VAQGDGSHYFSNDYGTHEKAVGRYRTAKKKARNSLKVPVKGKTGSGK